MKFLGRSLPSASSPAYIIAPPQTAMAATLSSSAASLLSKAARVAAPRASVLAARRAPTASPKSSFRGVAVEIKRVVPVAVSKRTMATTATIAVGDKLPDGTLSYFDAEGNLQSITVESLTKVSLQEDNAQESRKTRKNKYNILLHRRTQKEMAHN